MAYTPSLRLTLPLTGTLDGTWGDTVNNGITSLTDTAIAGTAAVIQGDVANYTLTSNSGATDEARSMFLNITGALTAARNVVCPTVSKLYFIKNSTTGGFAITLKTTAGTGISIPNGGTIMALYCDGTNVIDAVSYLSALKIGGLTASQAIFSDANKNLVSNAITGTGNVVMSTSPTLGGTIAGTYTLGGTPTISAHTLAGTVSGGGNQINNVIIGASTPLAGSFTTLTTSSTVTLSGGTANGVAYLNGSNVLTSGSALTFDGTTLNVGIGGVGKVRIGTASSGTFQTGLYASNGVDTDFQVRFKTGVSEFGTSTATPLAFSINGSEQMRLTSTGLGIGTSSPAYKLDIESTTTNPTARVRSNGGAIGNYAELLLQSFNSFSGSGQAYVRGVSTAAGNSNTALIFGVNNSGFGAPYEAMCLDSSGDLGLGVTPSAWSSTNGGFIMQVASGQSTLVTGHVAGTASGITYSQFYYAGTLIGSITQTGTTAVLYNTTSDYRLKTVIGPVADAGSRIDSLQPVEYEWKADGARTRGFLAHQFQEVYAGSVTGTKDAVDEDGKPKYQAMQASSSEVIADLVAEIQSLRKRLAAAGI